MTTCKTGARRMRLRCNLLLGISELITAMQHRPGPARIFDFVLAGAFAVLAVMWAVVVPR